MIQWRKGDILTADSLNTLSDSIFSRTMAGIPNTHAHARLAQGAWVQEDVMVYPWQVRVGVKDGKTVALVRGGRVQIGFGTDCSEGDGQGRLSRAAKWVEPWGTEWKEMPLKEKAPTTVWLVAHGETVSTPVPYSAADGDRCDGWFGEHVRLTADPEFTLEDAPPADCLRCWPLAVVDLDGYECPVVQLHWGDLCLFAVSGLLTEDGTLLTPQGDGAGAWGEAAGMETLCRLSFSAGADSCHGELHAGLDEHGGLAFALGKVRKLTADERDPDEPPPPPGPGPDPIPDPDPEPDPDDPDPHPVPAADGYYYTGVKPVDIHPTRGQFGTTPGYLFNLSVGEVTLIAEEDLFYRAAVTVSTENSGSSYDWPEGNAYGLTMYYGVTAEGGRVTVRWQSSFPGGDSLAKSAVATVNMGTMHATASVFFEDNFNLDSEHAPATYGSNILSFTPDGTMKRRHTVWVTDPFTGKKVRVIKERTYKKYKVALTLGVLKEIMKNKLRANAPMTAEVQPRTVTGSCTNVNAPTVTAGAVALTVTPAPAGVTDATGPLVPTFGLAYEDTLTMPVRVTGGASWNQGKEHGEIDGSLVLTVRGKEVLL